MSALLEVKNVTKAFGGGVFDRTSTIALENFTMSVGGEVPAITAIVGESGSGKTTLARLLLGLTDPSIGDVLYKGRPMKDVKGASFQKFLRDVQVIFQDPFEVYNPFYRVDHVLNMPIDQLGIAKSKKEKESLLKEALETVGLRPEETLGRYPHQLSGGQRQRVMVARAMIIKPKVIVADEPVSMIDASLRATVLGSLQKLRTDFSISIVYITHDLTTAYQICDNIVVLYRGAVTEAGDIESVVRSPKHPYTRLLIGSIPMPDPDLPWAAEAPPAISDVARSRQGCKFVDRCPAAMQKCLEQEPPAYQTDPERVVACFLYEGAPVLPNERMDEVLKVNAANPRR
jgi:oligopeptide/dipeptide ABC transporter ATP-binding protein